MIRDGHGRIGGINVFSFLLIYKMSLALYLDRTLSLSKKYAAW